MIAAMERISIVRSVVLGFAAFACTTTMVLAAGAQGSALLG